MRSDTSLGRQTICAFAALAVVVVALFVELATTVANVNDAGRSVDHARAVLQVSSEAGSDLTRLETNVHGWEDTGAGSFVGDWLVTRNDLLERMWELRRLTRDDPPQWDRVDATFARLGAYLTLHRPRTAPRTISVAAYRARFALERRTRLDAVLRASATVERTARRTIRRRQAEQRGGAHRALVLGIVGTIVVVGLVGLLAAYLTVAVVAPIRRLGSLARRLRDGELGSRGAVSGHPEVAAVASTMNAMAEELEHERRELRRSESRHRALIEHLPDAAVVLFDRELRCVTAEGTMLRGQGLEPSGLVGRSLRDTLTPEHHEQFLPRYRAALEGEFSRLEYRSLGDDAEYEMDVVPFIADGEVQGVFTVARDVTAGRQADRARRAADRRFASAFANAPIGMGLVSLDGCFLEVNAALCEITGYTREQLEATSPAAISHPDDVAASRAALAGLLSGEADHYEHDKRYLHAAGHVVDVAVHASLVRDEAGRPDHVVGQIIDVTDRKRFEAQLRHMADHDPLTGLLNRRAFEPELERWCAHMTRYGPEGALIVLDVDHFKQVNDTLGHSAGDQVIVAVGAILRTRLRDTDVVARLGGDEFAILLPKADRAQAEMVAQALVDGIRRETSGRSGERRRGITISVGVALLAEAGRTADEALVDADLAMYDAKAAGRDRYSVYDPERYLGSRVKTRGKWVQRIEEAIADAGFVLHAQPILDLRANRVSHHELLLRMRDAHGDLIPPAAFLSVAERYGLVARIDRWVAGQAVALLAEAEAAGAPRRLGVNVSGHSLGDPSLLRAVEGDLHRTGIDPSNLVFELSETAAVADIGRARRFAEALAALGCRFALDDFGAGFGSFYHLEHLPFDYLKIDGEFVARCLATRTDQLVIEAVVGVAHGLGKETVAEYVPDGRTRRLLARLGVDYAQGEHVGMPVPLERALAPLAAV